MMINECVVKIYKNDFSLYKKWVRAQRSPNLAKFVINNFF